MILADPSKVWSPKRTFLTAIIISSTSVVSICIVDQINEAMKYGMPNWIFFPLFFGAGLVYPVTTIVRFYKRLPSPHSGLVFAIGFAVSWYVTMEALQIVEYGPWKGFRPAERTVTNLLFRWSTRLLLSLAIIIPMTMSVWGICRLFKGRVFLQDGSLCGNCGYNLTGNVSGVCPECGCATKA